MATLYRAVLGLTLLACVVPLAYPAWRFQGSMEQRPIDYEAGRAFILEPPAVPPSEQIVARVAWDRLAAEVLAVLALGGGMLLVSSVVNPATAGTRAGRSPAARPQLGAAD